MKVMWAIFLHIKIAIKYNMKGMYSSLLLHVYFYLNFTRALWEVVTVENDYFFFGWIVLSDDIIKYTLKNELQMFHRLRCLWFYHMFSKVVVCSWSLSCAWSKVNVVTIWVFLVNGFDFVMGCIVNHLDFLIC